MTQIHRNFSDEEVAQLLRWYEKGEMNKQDVTGQLGIKDSRFYTLLKAYRDDSKAFTVAYSRDCANNKLPRVAIAQIHHELEEDKKLIDNPAIPIMFHNYAAVRDAVEETTGHNLSAQTVVNYAKKWGFYMERPKKRAHTREVLTNHVGMLLQHDASTHQWSPYAIDNNGKPIKWSLITTLDDHSRKLLYANMFERETAWAHIQALETVVLSYGVGIRYYADNHSIFRYVAHRDRDRFSAANLHRALNTDDIAPQWKQCVEAVGMKVAYAMSPEAKGKIERPYGWLQDRIVRRAARSQVKTIEDVRIILASEIDRYNNRQVHSTTSEIPTRRFEKAIIEDRNCFRQLDMRATVPSVHSTKDLFCLRAERVIDGYGQISFCGYKLPVPQNIGVAAAVTLHVIPQKQTTEIRFLKNDVVLGYTTVPTPISLGIN